MNERLKELRKALNMTQQEFADAIRVKRNTVATYEMGRSGISDAAVALICKEFNVDEEWLRTGKGKMFVDVSREMEIAKFTKNLLLEESDSFKNRLISALAKMTVDEWELLERKLREILGE